MLITIATELIIKKLWCLKSVEEIFFNKAVNDFLMNFYRARKTDYFASQSFDTRSERKVMTLNTLGIDLSNQVHFVGDFSDVAPPIIGHDSAQT